MKNYPFGLALAVLVTCVPCSVYGQRRRNAGGRVTARDTVIAAGAAWAVFWLALAAPSLQAVGRPEAWSASGPPVAVWYLAFATAPLALFLSAAYLPRFFVTAWCEDKKKTEPHPLD